MIHGNSCEKGKHARDRSSFGAHIDQNHWPARVEPGSGLHTGATALLTPSTKPLPLGSGGLPKERQRQSTHSCGPRTPVDHKLRRHRAPCPPHTSGRSFIAAFITNVAAPPRARRGFKAPGRPDLSIKILFPDAESES